MNHDLTALELERERLRASWRATGLHRGIDFADAIGAAASGHLDDRLRFTAEGHAESFTIGELLDDGARLAAVLYDLGVRPKDSVALHLPSWPETARVLAACVILRATVVPIPAIYGQAEVRFILEDANVSTYFVGDRWRSHDYLAGLSEVSTAKGLERVVVVGETVPAGCFAWSDLVERARRAVPVSLSRHRGPATDRAFIVYTSGSTSNPKGGQHSSDTLLAELHQGVAQFGRPGRYLEGFPAGHMGGLLAMLRPLLYGFDTVLLDNWDADLAAHLVDELKITSTMGPPFYLTTLLDEADKHGLDLSSIAEYSTGGTGVAPALIERADSAGFHPYRTYGSTEHPTTTTSSPSDTLDERARTDGRPLDGVDLILVDEDEQPVPEGVEGQVFTRGPDQFLGYTDPEANLQAFAPGGWLRSGDLAIFENGRLTISGRQKDVIIRGGENLSSEEIEGIMMRHPAVSHVAVVGAKDSLYGERACAFVVLRPESKLTLEDVREHFSQARVARQKTPEFLVICEELPRTAAGKVRKNDLRRDLEQGAVTLS